MFLGVQVPTSSRGRCLEACRENPSISTRIKLLEVQWNQLNDSVQVIQKKAGTGEERPGEKRGEQKSQGFRMVG